MSAPNVRTPGGNRADAETSTGDEAIVGDCIAASKPDKAFATVQARAALLGVELVQLGDGTFLVKKWGLFRTLETAADVERFLRQVGGPAA